VRREFFHPDQTFGQKFYVRGLERLRHRIRGVFRNVPRQVDPAPCQRALAHSTFLQGVHGEKNRTQSRNIPLTLPISFHWVRPEGKPWKRFGRLRRPFWTTCSRMTSRSASRVWNNIGIHEGDSGNSEYNWMLCYLWIQPHCIIIRRRIACTLLCVYL
jgi:hypothetical protein